MSEQELCETYGVDWTGPYNYEAVDRLELLLRYRSSEYLDRVSFRGEYASEFEFASERQYAEETEQWADERGLEQVAALARQVRSRLEALGRFSRRLAEEVREEVEIRMDECHDLRDWATRLQEGDFDPSEIIDTINRIAQSDSESGEVHASALMESLYPFVAGLVSDTQSRFDGHLGRALAARFVCPPQGDWTHYRGVSAYLFQLPAPGDSNQGPKYVQLHPIAAPTYAPRWNFPPFASQTEAMTVFRTEVDAFWRLNPPVDPDRDNRR
jgi:hypothetical protein